MPEYETIDKYDRIYGAMHDVTSLFTKPTTIENVQFTGRAETFVVQTCRHDDGDWIFIKYIDEKGVVRLALPPKVTKTIASQREAVTKRRRSISSRAAMKARMDAGEVIGFKRKQQA